MAGLVRRPARSPWPSSSSPSARRPSSWSRASPRPTAGRRTSASSAARCSSFPSAEPRLWRGGHHREADAERAVICRACCAGEPLVVVATPAALDVPLPAPPRLHRRARCGCGVATGSTASSCSRRSSGAATSAPTRWWRWGSGACAAASSTSSSPTHAAPGAPRVLRRRHRVDPPLRPHHPALDRQPSTSCWSCRSADADEAAETRPPARLPARGRPRDRRRAGAARRDRRGVARAPPAARASWASGQRVELRGDRGAAVPGAADREHVLDTQAVEPLHRPLRRSSPRRSGDWRAEGFRVRLVAADGHQAEHLRQILREHDVEAPIAGGLDGAEESPASSRASARAASPSPALGLVLLTEAEIFGARRRTLRRPKYQRGSPITAFTDLAVGDLVVHEDHGIGRYLGLRTMNVGDRDGDFLLLEYSEGNQLYLPVERLDLISKYLGGDSGRRAARPPRRRVVAAREGVRARGPARDGRGAAEALRAQRAAAEGTPSPPTRRGSASSRPPSASRRRPISCGPSRRSSATWSPSGPWTGWSAGDVGYGKTEVALARRLQGGGRRRRRWRCWCPRPCSPSSTGRPSPSASARFPAKVELLSRFRSPAEQKAVVEGLAAGTVDVVIGTHRLLSKDVRVQEPRPARSSTRSTASASPTRRRSSR